MSWVQGKKKQSKNYVWYHSSMYLVYAEKNKIYVQTIIIFWEEVVELWRTFLLLLHFVFGHVWSFQMGPVICNQNKTCKIYRSIKHLVFCVSVCIWEYTHTFLQNWNLSLNINMYLLYVYVMLTFYYSSVANHLNCFKKKFYIYNFREHLYTYTCMQF